MAKGRLQVAADEHFIAIPRDGFERGPLIFCQPGIEPGPQGQFVGLNKRAVAFLRESLGKLPSYVLPRLAVKPCTFQFARCGVTTYRNGGDPAPVGPFDNCPFVVSAFLCHVSIIS
jgi:hypothetical protein